MIQSEDPLLVSEIVKGFVENFFSLPIGSILDATIAEDIDGWDSLANAEIILGLEDKLDVELDVEDLLALENVGRIAEVFQRRLREKANLEM